MLLRVRKSGMVCWSDAGSSGSFHCAIVDKESGKALGTFALMRIDRGNRVIEVGARPIHQQLSAPDWPAQYLLARYVFEELEYRYEWKCDALPISRQDGAAWLFTYEGRSVRQSSIKGATETPTGCLWLTGIGRSLRAAWRNGRAQTISTRCGPANKFSSKF